MKILKFFAISILLLLSNSCGKKSNTQNSKINNKYILGAFFDVNNPSTLNLDELKDVPQTLDLKDIMTPVKDQDDRNTCSFFAAIALVESAIKKRMNMNVNLSEEYLVNATKSQGVLANVQGGRELDNLIVAINQKVGFLLERDWPYQPNWFGKRDECVLDITTAPLKCFSHNAPPENILQKKISAEHFKLRYFKPDRTNGIIRILAIFKAPINISLPVNYKGWGDDGNVEYNEEMRAECLAAKDTCGSHAVILTGYDINKKIFLFKNSWSESWGNKGYGTLPFEVVDRYVDRDFVMVELNDSINIPESFEKDDFDVTQFSAITTIKSDQSVQTTYTAHLDHVGFTTLKVKNSLVQKKSSSEMPADEENTEIVKLNNEDTKIFETPEVTVDQFFFQNQEAGSLEWSDKTPGIISLSSKIMQTSTVKALSSLHDSRLLIKTTIYSYGNLGTKPIKTVYSPL